MNPITVLFITFAAFVAISLVVAEGPPMPADMPANLQTQFEAIKAQIEALPKVDGHPDFSKIPEAVKEQMEQLRKDYESATGKSWPHPSGPPPSSS